MANGSVRKKGRKWYFRFYVENESETGAKGVYGRESKSETEAMLRKAMEDMIPKRWWQSLKTSPLANC